MTQESMLGITWVWNAEALKASWYLNICYFSAFLYSFTEDIDLQVKKIKQDPQPYVLTHFNKI